MTTSGTSSEILHSAEYKLAIPCNKQEQLTIEHSAFLIIADQRLERHVGGILSRTYFIVRSMNCYLRDQVCQLAISVYPFSSGYFC